MFCIFICKSINDFLKAILATSVDMEHEVFYSLKFQVYAGNQIWTFGSVVNNASDCPTVQSINIFFLKLFLRFKST